MSNGRPSERGFLEIADDAGNVIDDVNRLRLGPDFTLTRNPSDPSAVIAVSGVLGNGVIIAVDSVSALRSILIPLSAAIYQTKGYYSPLDGGEATYLWDSSSTAADDGGSIIKLAAYATGRMRLVLLQNKVNVRQFGAKGINENTDTDQDCCKRAIAYAGSLSPVPEIYFPTGTYRLRYGTDYGSGNYISALMLTSNMHVRGDGQSSVIFWPGSPGAPGVDPMTFQPFLLRGDDISISDLAFQGQNGNSSGVGYVQSESFSHAAIDVWFKFGAPEIYKRVYIDRCTFLNLCGFSAHDQGGSVRGGRFNDNVCYYCGNGENLCGYEYQHCRNVFVSSEGIETSGANVIISDNYISGVTAEISISGFQTGGQFYNTNQVSVVGNVIEMTDSINTAGIIAGSAKNCTIVGNTVRNAPLNSIEVIDSDSVSVIGNSILRDNSAGIAGTTFSIYMNGVTNASIVGNVIAGRGFAAFGIGINNTSLCQIANNDVSGMTNSLVYIFASSDVSLSHNTCKDSSAFGLNAQSSHDVLLFNNLFTGAVTDIFIDSPCSKFQISRTKFTVGQILGQCSFDNDPAQGTTIVDADATIAVGGGSQYSLTSVTASRAVTFGVTGSPVNGEVMRLDVMRTEAFTIVCKDDAGTTKLTVPASVRAVVTAVFDSVSGHFSGFQMVRVQ
jgi:hypothetical protein